MSKFCRYCGTELPEGAFFCQNCGNAVPKHTAQIQKPETMKYCRHCGAISNPGAKFCRGCGREAEPVVLIEKVQRRKKRSAVIPVIAAVLAVAVFVCFVYPGSVRKSLFGSNGKKQITSTKSAEELAKEYAAIDVAYAAGTLFNDYGDVPDFHGNYDWFCDENSEEVIDDETVDLKVLPEGKSKAFSMKTDYGITISAEKNALDRDRDFKVDPVSDEKYEEIEENLIEAVGCPGLIINACEVDAGLADDEVLPGNYSVEMDLEKMGLDASDYDNLKFYRIDDSGKWYEYQTSISGSTVSMESNQNSALCVVLVLAAPFIANGITAKSNGAYINPFTGCFDLEYEGKKVMEVMLDRSSFYSVLLEGNEDHYREMEEQVRKEVYNRMRDEESPLLDDYPFYSAKLFEKWSNNPSKATDGKRLQQKFNSRYKKLLKEKVQNDPDYNRVKRNLEEYFNSPVNMTDVRAELEAVTKVNDAALGAWGYFKKNSDLRMPNYKLRIELSGAQNEFHGALVSPVVGNPYIVITMSYLARGDNIAYDGLRCTMCHEMFHAIQRRYVSKTMSTLKFDEMSAQDVECMAYDYFNAAEENPITAPREAVLENLSDVFLFGVPLDSYQTEYPEGTLKGEDDSASSYPIAPFLAYLREQTGKTYSMILPKYHALLGKRAVTTIIKAGFEIDSDEKLTEYYHAFAKDFQTEFYKEALKEEKLNKVFSPLVMLQGGKRKVKVDLLNKNYTIRVRRVWFHDDEDERPEYAMVLKYDDTYKDMMSDFEITPLHMTEDNEYKEFDEGLFFEPGVFADKKDDTVYLMEVDGGTADTTEGWVWNDYSGYTLYLMGKPETPEVSISGDELSVKLPEADDSPSSEIMGGYVITLRCGNTEVESDYVTRKYLKENPVESFDISKLKIDGKKLTEDDRNGLVVVIQECVEGTYEAGDPCLGPESDPSSQSEDNIFGTWEISNEITEYSSPMFDQYIGLMGKYVGDAGVGGTSGIDQYIEGYNSIQGAQVGTVTKGEMIIRPSMNQTKVEGVLKFEGAPEQLLSGEYDKASGELKLVAADQSYAGSDGTSYDAGASGFATTIRIKFGKDSKKSVQTLTGESSVDNEYIKYKSVLTGTKISEKY